MRAATYNGRRDIRVEQVPDPKIESGEDVILRITTSGICASEVALYYRQGVDFVHLGTVLGHEYVGVVEEVGRDVRRIRKGDRVIGSPFPGCGACPECRDKLPGRCRVNGFAALGATLSGSHAEAMRVPYADQTLERVPPDLSDEQVICVADQFSAALYHASLAGDLAGKPAAVLGLGLLGFMGVIALLALGADPVIAVDVIPGRLAWAEEMGAVTIDARLERVGRRMRTLAGGRGVLFCLETSGDEEALSLGVGGVRPGGTLVLAGTYVEDRILIPTSAYWKNLRVFPGVAQAREWSRVALHWISTGRVDLVPFVTDTLPLDDAPAGFLRLDRSPLFGFTEDYNPVAESCFKVVLKP
jgi:threonine dehydrogenase-like Zn-dependent dehydrogenase